jgi:sirohydrochlorin ferrochelatase
VIEKTAKQFSATESCFQGMIPEKCAAVFRKDHAKSKSQSAMTIRPNLIALGRELKRIPL